MLFATIAAGGGHVATANAMAEAVAEASGGAMQTRVSDIMAEYGPTELDKRHKDSWRRLLARGRLVRIGQTLTDAVPAATRFMQDALLDGFARNVTAAFAADPPALIVANHGWLATAFTMARRRHGLKTRLVIYATEPFDASALWSTPDAEVVLAPSAAAKSALVAVGVPAERVLVAGYPVAERFLRPPQRYEARESLGLDDGFTCLVTLGAEGVVSDDAGKALVGLAASGVNLLCVTGRNAKLKAKLEGMFASKLADAPSDARGSARGPARAHQGAGAGFGGKVQVFGFVADMERLLSAADLVVGKAGPASTMEALAVGRPVLATAYAGLNELAVTRYLASHGLGGYVPGWSRLTEAVAAWRTDPARLAAAGTATEQLDFMAMKRGLGAYLVDCARSAGGKEPGAASAGGAAGATGATGATGAAEVTSFLSLASRLEPAAFGLVTRASLEGSPDGSLPGSRPGPGAKGPSGGVR